MLMMHSLADCQTEHGCGLCAGRGSSVKQAKPAQVRVQVPGGHALEAQHPQAQAADEGVDVLHMPRAVHTYAPAEIDRLMLHAQGVCGAGQGDAAIGAQNSIRRQQRLKRLADQT